MVWIRQVPSVAVTCRFFLWFWCSGSFEELSDFPPDLRIWLNGTVGRPPLCWRPAATTSL